MAGWLFVGIIAIVMGSVCIILVSLKHNQLNLPIFTNYGYTPQSDLRPLVISLSTIPSRINICLNNLVDMIDKGIIGPHDRVEMNLPRHFARTGDLYPVVYSPHPQINIYDNLEDLGPATKILPTIQRYQNAQKKVLIVSIDDDRRYPPGMFAMHSYLAKLYNYEAVTIPMDRPRYTPILQHLTTAQLTLKNVAALPHQRQAWFVEGYLSVGYPSELLDVSAVKQRMLAYPKCRNSDDLQLALQLALQNIPIVALVGKSLNNHLACGTDIWSVCWKSDALNIMQNHTNTYNKCAKAMLAAADSSLSKN